MEGHITRQTRMTADLHFLFKKKKGYMWTPVDFGIYSTFNRNGWIA